MLSLAGGHVDSFSSFLQLDRCPPRLKHSEGRQTWSRLPKHWLYNVLPQKYGIRRRIEHAERYKGFRRRYALRSVVKRGQCEAA